MTFKERKILKRQLPAAAAAKDSQMRHRITSTYERNKNGGIVLGSRSWEFFTYNPTTLNPISLTFLNLITNFTFCYGET